MRNSTLLILKEKANAPVATRRQVANQQQSAIIDITKLKKIVLIKIVQKKD
jgi:hypothetical protein